MRIALSIFMIVTILIGCKKSDNTNSNDEIVYRNYNKIVTINNQDSIPGTCKALVFEIINSKEPDLIGILKVNNTIIVCDGYNSILTYPDSKTIFPLEPNHLISSNSLWSDINNLNLDAFADLEGKYIGYRSCTYPEGTSTYNYGWIKINLSNNMDTIIIVDQAINVIDNKSILSGQTH